MSFMLKANFPNHLQTDHLYVAVNIFIQDPFLILRIIPLLLPIIILHPTKLFATIVAPLITKHQIARKRNEIKVTLLVNLHENLDFILIILQKKKDRFIYSVPSPPTMVPIILQKRKNHFICSVLSPIFLVLLHASSWIQVQVSI